MASSNDSPYPAILAALGILMSLYPVTEPLAHGAHEPAAVEIVGEILDLECYIAHDVRGHDNSLCAANHPETGQPLALLTDDGRLYILHAGHRTSLPLDQARIHNGRRATVTGVATGTGRILLLEVRNIRIQSERP